jgi:hypothetical protein
MTALRSGADKPCPICAPAPLPAFSAVDGAVLSLPFATDGELQAARERSAANSVHAPHDIDEEGRSKSSPFFRLEAVKELDGPVGLAMPLSPASDGDRLGALIVKS